MRHERFRVNPEKVVHETIEGEAIVIHLQHGFYYSLAGAGADAWELFATGQPLATIERELGARYAGDPATIANEVRRLAVELADEDLIEPVGDAPEPEPAVAPANGNGSPRPPFVPPALSKYTDMQDFLLVDPIHETTDAGWPHLEGTT